MFLTAALRIIVIYTFICVLFLYTCGTEILAKTRIVIRLPCLHSLPLSVFCAIPFKLNVLKGPFNKISTTTKGFLYKCIYALKKIRYIYICIWNIFLASKRYTTYISQYYLDYFFPTHKVYFCNHK